MLNSYDISGCSRDFHAPSAGLTGLIYIEPITTPHSGPGGGICSPDMSKVFAQAAIESITPHATHSNVLYRCVCVNWKSLSAS